jgi:hypothetical protein
MHLQRELRERAVDALLSLADNLLFLLHQRIIQMREREKERESLRDRKRERERQKEKEKEKEREREK